MKCHISDGSGGGESSSILGGGGIHSHSFIIPHFIQSPSSKEFCEF